MMLEVKNLHKTYKKPGLMTTGRKVIIDDISFTMSKGECLGIIGESGSGKSTLGRMILGIERPDKGEVLFKGENVLKKTARKGMVSAVFQDYTSSVSPTRTVKQAIEEPLKLEKKEYEDAYIYELLEKVGLDRKIADRFQHELSGGQAQRVCIARAVASKPEFILLDEAISSLDVSIQVQVLDLLRQLKDELSMSYLFITHDIQAAAYICNRLIIFKDGKIVEETDIDKIGDVKEEYSKKLFNSVIVV